MSSTRVPRLVIGPRSCWTKDFVLCGALAPQVRTLRISFPRLLSLSRKRSRMNIGEVLSGRAKSNGVRWLLLSPTAQQVGHEVVSRLDARDFWLGRLPTRRLMAEAALVRSDMKRFAPDAWLVYCPAIQYPDLFGWWQRPSKYIILKGGEQFGQRGAEAMPRPWRDLYTFAYQQSLKRAHMFEAIRPSAVENLRTCGIPEERICFLPRAIRTWTHIPTRAEARRVLHLPQEVPIVLCVSRFTVRRYKGDPRPGKAESVLELLRAFRALPSNSLIVLVGHGPGRREPEEEAARSEIAGRVRFAGQVDHDDVVWYYAACDFFAFPEKSESNRAYQASLEAQACGRPVLTMDNPTSQTTVEAARTGLLAKDPREFQAHLLALAQDRSRCDEMGRAAAAFIARSFSMKVRASQIEQLLLGSSQGSDVGYPLPMGLGPRRAGLEPATNRSAADRSTN